MVRHLIRRAPVGSRIARMFKVIGRVIVAALMIVAMVFAG
jgi:hypothetical protein